MSIPTAIVIQGDCIEELRKLPEASVNCCVTSPPYWGLRDYGVPPSVWGGDSGCEHEFTERRWYTEQSAAKTNGSSEAFSEAGEANAKRLKEARWRKDASCIKCGAWRGCHGLEPTPEMYIANAVAVFREVRRVLRADGTLWLNIGDTYATNTGENGGKQGYKGQRRDRTFTCETKGGCRIPEGLKAKDLIGIPWMVAFALRADGWWLRQDIIWEKPNPMPESVTDRCTKAHEYLFLLTKSNRYYYDAEAIAEPVAESSIARVSQNNGHPNWNGNRDRSSTQSPQTLDITKLVREDGLRNKRSVWTVNTEPYPEAHFATFPPKLIAPCILAGCQIGGTVLDPFGGSGTTGRVALELGRSAILIELNPTYAEMARQRTNVTPGLQLS